MDRVSSLKAMEWLKSCWLFRGPDLMEYIDVASNGCCFLSSMTLMVLVLLNADGLTGLADLIDLDVQSLSTLKLTLS